MWRSALARLERKEEEGTRAADLLAGAARRAHGVRARAHEEVPGVGGREGRLQRVQREGREEHGRARRLPTERGVAATADGAGRWRCWEGVHKAAQWWMGEGGGAPGHGQQREQQHPQPQRHRGPASGLQCIRRQCWTNGVRALTQVQQSPTGSAASVTHTAACSVGARCARVRHRTCGCATLVKMVAPAKASDHSTLNHGLRAVRRHDRSDLCSVAGLGQPGHHASCRTGAHATHHPWRPAARPGDANARCVPSAIDARRSSCWLLSGAPRQLPAATSWL